MPWEQSLPMDQKTQFVSESLRDTTSFTELCDRYGISRKTGYKWIDHYSLGCVINPRANAMFYHSLAPDSEFWMNRGTSIV